MALYADQFLTKHDFPHREAMPSLRYVIASTPRCGSHRLGHALAETGCLGFPLEYLNPINLPTWQERLGTSGWRDTLEALWTVRTSPNGCFGLKLHYRQLAALPPSLSPDELLQGARVIRLHRRDLLAQAISLVRARQTGAWISAQAPARPAEYDGRAIERALADLARSNAGWDLALGRAGVVPLALTFEEVVGDVAGAVQTIADFLGVPLSPSEARSTPQPSRQTSAESPEWRERFLAEGRPALPPVPPSAVPPAARRLATRVRSAFGRLSPTP